MAELIEFARVWPELLVVILLFGFAPGFCLRLIVLLYPRKHDRRRELIAELYAVPYPKRLIWVASQLETALFEGVAARISALRSRLRARRNAHAEEEAELPTPARRPAFVLPAGETVSEGTTFGSRRELSASGVHRALQSGIVGTGRHGAESILVDDSYGDLDAGDFIVYAGHGGLDSRGAQIADQTFEATGNAALYASWRSNRPVRVVRRGGSSSPYAPPPTAGYRYDGYYAVVGAWSETGASGRLVCRFALVRCGSPAELRYRKQVAS